MIDIKEEIKKYWDYRSKDYDLSPGHTDLPEVWKEVLAEIFKGKMRILDIGTGTGFLAIILAELGHEVVGIDISEEMLKVARRKAADKGVRIDFRIGDAENLPFDDEEFDATICRHVLWTLPNPERAISEWKRVVKKGGKVVIIDGNWEHGIFTALKRLLGKAGMVIFEGKLPKNNSYSKEVKKALPCYRSLTEERVAELMKKAGLSRVSIRDITWIREMILKNRPIFYRFAWSGKSYFLAEGIKEV